jgi:hypothetical protein
LQGRPFVEPAAVEKQLVAGRAQPPLERVATVDAFVDAEVQVAVLATVHRDAHGLGRLGVRRAHNKMSSMQHVNSASISPTAISKPDVAILRSTTLTAAVERSLMGAHFLSGI